MVTNMFKQGLVVTLIALQIWQPVLAGVVATAPGVTQSQAANGVPVVNIAAPGSSGISHNTYTRFDVDTNGLILNNSGQPVNTQLGGYIPGNANLAHGSARLILNEVSGTLPSQLNGYMEIAGQKAEMVIANPAGITCSGCGFINTNRATLTTGLPQFGSDGSLTGFTVENGLVRIEGVGLNATNIERLALYSRALELNAALYANELQVVTGANTINAVTGMISPATTNTTTSAPVYAIDSSTVGGMYANTIRLVGTEAGVGMRLAGPVAALTGKLEILGNGDVRLARASAQGDISVSARDQLLLSTQVTAGGNAALQADDIVLEGTALLAATGTTLAADNISTALGAQVAARGDLQLTAGTLNNAGVLTTATRLQVDISGQLNNSGSIEAETALNLNAGAWTNRGQLMLREGAMNINVSQAIDNRTGSIRHGGTEFTLHAAVLDNSGGEIASDGISTLTVSGDASLLNNEGILQGNASLKINSHGLDNSNGQVLSDGLITLQMNNAALLNTSGVIEAIGAINVGQAAGLDNSSGSLLANGDITLELANSVLTNTGGLIEASSDLLITNANGLTNQSGVLRAGQNLTLYLPMFDRAASSGQYSAIGQLAIHTTDGMLFYGEDFTTSGSLLLDAGLAGIKLDSRVVSGTAATLQAGTITLGDDGFLATQGVLTVASKTLTNLGVMYGREALTLHIEDELDNGSEDLYRAAAIISAGNISITRADGSRLTTLNNYAGQIESLLGNITLKAEVVNNINVGWAEATDVWIESKPVVYHDDFSPTGSMADIVASSGSAYSNGDYYFELTWDDSIPGYPRDSAANSCTNGACYYFYRDKEVVTHSDVTSQGNKAWIIASSAQGAGNGNIWIDAGTLNNNRSTLSAAGLLDIKVDATGSINNIATTLFDVSDINREIRWKACGSSGACSRGQLVVDLDSEALESRTNQLITATLEGGLDVNLHGTVVNGEKEKVGHTVTSGTGAYSSVPSSAPTDETTSEVTALGELGILDPTSRPGFQLPGNGVFHLNSNPAHPYLIETDPAINTYPGFLGSGYLIDYLDWAPGSTQRRLGDSYYELMLIREALLASIGSRFVDASVTDERTQYEYLMQNAIAASESLQLSPGISLSRAQIDSLQQDIVWMEEREIAGQKVLVPVVYLAQGSSRLLSDGAVIGGGTLSIEGDTFANAGLVRAHNSITINAARDISNLGGTIAAVGDIELHSGTDILNESGTITGHDVLLQAEGDIINRTWTQRDEAGSGSNSSWSTIAGDTASITATGKLTQDAGGDIRLEAAELTGENIELIAGSNIILDTLQIDEGYRLDSGNWQQAEAYVRHLQTQVIAARDLSIRAGADITAIAANLKAGSSATLEAGRNITLLATEETDHYEEHSRSGGSFGRSKSHDLVHDESRMLGTTIAVGSPEAEETSDQTETGNLVMNAGSNITLYASQVAATGQADITAGNNINVIAGINTTSHSEKSSKEGVGTFSNNQQGYISQEAAVSAISAGGDLNLNAGQDIRLTASVLHSDNTLRIGGEEIDQAALSQDKETDEEKSASRPANVIVDTLALSNESWNESQKGFKGPLKELVKAISFVVAPMISVLTAGQVDMPEIIIAEHDRTRSKDVLQAGSSLQAEDLSVHAKGTVALINADVSVTKKAEISANDIVIGAVAETHTVTHDEGRETVAGLGMKVGKDEVRVAGVEMTKHSLVDQSTLVVWNGTTIDADQLVLKAQHDLDVLGASINVAGDAALVAGNQLTIGGNESGLTNEHKEITDVTTISASVRNAYLDAALAVKAMVDAKDSIKDAKQALEDAEAKASRGELDPDDVKYFRINLAAATANLVQLEIAMAAALAAGAAAAGTGFYVSGSAQHDKTVTTSTTTQGQWQGSNITVGGNAALIAGEKIKVQGSDVNVNGTLIVDAKTIALVAGEEHSSSKSKTTQEHEGFSISSQGGGSVNAGMHQSDADSQGTHYANTHLSAGTLNSTSESLQLAGAVIEADNVGIRTGTLSVVSLQDAFDSKSKTVGGNIGVSGGSGGVTGGSIAADFQKSETERRWVAEQSGIIGHNSIGITAEDTLMTGAIIANAVRDENGNLVDQSNLQLKTNTLTVNNLYDVDRTKTIGANLAVGLNFGSGTKVQGTQTNAPAGNTFTEAAAVASKGGGPINSITAGGLYNGHITERTTFATLGMGQVEVGGELLTDENVRALVNRDVANAQVITKDQDIGGLNASVTVDGRWFSKDGRAEMAQQQRDILDNAGKVGAGLVVNGIYASTMVASVVTGEVDQMVAALDKVSSAKDISKNDAALAKTINEVDKQATVNTPELSARLDGALSPEDKNTGNRVGLTDDLTDEHGVAIAGAASKASNTIYISTVTAAPLVDVMAHEAMHINGAGEKMSGATGWLANAAFAMGNVLNQDAIKNASVYNFAALTPAASQANAHLFTVEQVLGRTDNWGSVGHQSTMAAGMYLGGFSAEVAKAGGVAAFAADADSRNAMSGDSLLHAYDPNAPQQDNHVLDGEKDQDKVKAKQVELTQQAEVHFKALNAMTDAKDIAAYLNDPKVQKDLHALGDSFAHVDANGQHYEPGMGHLFPSLASILPWVDTNPDDPAEHPEAYANMFQAITQAASNATGSPRASASDVSILASTVSNTQGKNAEETEKLQMQVLQRTLNDYHPTVTIDPATNKTMTTAPNVIEAKNLDDWGFLGRGDGALAGNKDQVKEKINEALSIKDSSVREEESESKEESK